jgi:hypothetical protein
MDLRFPVGILFTALGVVLAGYGLLAPHESGRVWLGININLVWGLLMLLFGALMTTAAMRSSRRSRRTSRGA